MPVPPHYLLTWGGIFNSDPSEIWANNLRIGLDDNSDAAAFISKSSAEVESSLDTLVPKISAHFNATTSGYGSNARLTYVKLNEIGTDGRYKSATTSHTRDIPAPYPAGGATATTHSLATALVVTFLTGASRGPASRGRIFIPQPAATLNAAFRLTDVRCNEIAASWRTFLDDLNIGTPQSPHHAAVVSDRGGENGTLRTITRVQVGDVLDYMGSRRSRLKETRYTSASFN